MTVKKKSISAEEFDRRFDAGESIIDYLDLDSAVRPHQQPKRVNVDFPVWMVNALDREAKRLGVTRQSVIKVWLAERLDRQAAEKKPGGKKDEAA